MSGKTAPPDAPRGSRRRRALWRAGTGLLLALLGAAPAPGQQSEQEVFLSTEKGMGKIELVFPDPEAAPDARTTAKTVWTILWRDLTFSDLFLFLPQSATADLFPYRSRAGLLKALEKRGARLVLLSTVRARGTQLIVELKLYDVKSRELIFGQRYRGQAGQVRRLSHQAAQDLCFALTGRQSIFTSQLLYTSRQGGEDDLYLMDYDGENRQRLTTLKKLCLSPTADRAGDRVVFTTYWNGEPDLFMLHRPTGKYYNFAVAPGTQAAAAWAPVGDQIAFASSETGNSELYVMSADGRGKRRLTFNQAIDTSPSWSPNGREIAFTSDRTGLPQVYVIDADGGNERRLTFEGSYNTSPAWSTRGDQVAYVTQDRRGMDICTLDLKTGAIQRLTSGAGRNDGPVWSPTGEYIAFFSTRFGREEIFLMRADGSGQQRITRGGVNRFPVWILPRDGP